MSATFFRSSAEKPWKAVRQAATAKEREIGSFMVYPSLFVIIVIFAFCGFLLRFLFELGSAGDFGICAVGEIIKQRGAVGFGPEADFASVLEGVIFPYESPLAVKGDDEIVVFKVNAQGVPFVGSDFRVDAFLFTALAVYGVVDGDVAFEGIGAGDVIVVGIFATPEDAAGLVFLAGKGLELHFDKAVFEVGILFDADRVGGFAGLFQDVGFAGSGIVGNDFPFGLAAAGLRGGPAGRWRAGLEVVEVGGVCRCDAKRKGADKCSGSDCFHVSIHVC